MKAASNAWVVSGACTDTGKPILCNDPHLTLNVPNAFLSYHITVECDDNKEENTQFSGVQAVGMPAICIGHNEGVAFGITVGVCDTADIFVERFEDEKSNKYEVDGEWKECKVRKEVIQIKGEQDYIFQVKETHHGPILSPTDYDEGIEKGPYSHLAETNLNAKCQKENEKYCLRYAICATFLKPRDEIIGSDCPVEVFAKLLESRNIKIMAANLKKVAFPNLNFILGDNLGNYGWTTNGLIPIRASTDSYDPMLPQPGWLSKYDWNGYIPLEELPNSINPKAGYVVSCNNRMVDPDKYPYYLGFSFALGFRAKRASMLIDKQLSENKKITMEYVQEMQSDVYDLSSTEFVKNIMTKFDLAKVIENHVVELQKWIIFVSETILPKSIRGDKEIDAAYYNDKVNREKAKYAWKILSEWDHEYNEESLGASVFDAFACVLTRRVVIAGIYLGLSDPSQRQNKDDDKEDEEEKVKISDNQEILKSVKTLSANIMRNTYNRVFSGMTAFFYKRLAPSLTMFGCDNANEECWWIKNYGNRENLLLISLIDAIDCLEFWSGTNDRSQWKWGGLHEVEIFHPVSAKLGPQPFNSNKYPLRGGQYTLCMTRPNFEGIVENPLKTIRASVASWRQCIDCNDWNKSKCILPMGTSGNVSSPYYQNQLKPFVECKYIPMLWDKENVEENKASELICDPLRSIDDDKAGCVIL